MKTAMQQLIDEIVEHLTYDDDLTEDARITLERMRIKCEGKLEIEKQQVIDAREQGIKDGYGDYSDTEWGRDTEMKTSEQYYNETFASGEYRHEEQYTGQYEINGNNVEKVPNVASVVEWIEKKLDVILPLDINWDKINNILEQAKEIEEKKINSKTEISDDELEKLAEKEYPYDELVDTDYKGMIISAERAAWIDGIKYAQSNFFL